jgi:hypothetical protein
MLRIWVARLTGKLTLCRVLRVAVLISPVCTIMVQHVDLQRTKTFALELDFSATLFHAEGSVQTGHDRCPQ